MIPSNKKIKILLYEIDFNNELKKGFDAGLWLYPGINTDGPSDKDLSLVRNINIEPLRNVNFDQIKKDLEDWKWTLKTIENIGSSIGEGLKSIGWGTGSAVKDILKGGADGIGWGLNNLIMNPVIIGILLIGLVLILKK